MSCLPTGCDTQPAGAGSPLNAPDVEEGWLNSQGQTAQIADSPAMLYSSYSGCSALCEKTIEIDNSYDAYLFWCACGGYAEKDARSTAFRRLEGAFAA
jgi:hypothetical protein